MGTIKRLPEAVRNMVRSGIILFDLTRVVEELVFNSLDAGATKVFVYVGVGSCYVKVVDDGSGISRDGLVLLGERYATSKLHPLANMGDASGTFGFRGEALASISDVSLLEITTKAYGKPNGYRKVMKGSKCLYLRIDDERKDVGTTVVARDLFHNQPVRRKYMQSRPKKILHSVKKSVLRIALVHSTVSFKVIDMESEDVLLCTRTSSSPLALLMSSFGIEDCSFLHEVNSNDGALKISGYISGPCDSISVKAFQYVYINSRFVCKGPIHKLLNRLAASFDCLVSWKASNESLKGKRSKCQACPAYLLNLRCPQSLYDLSFEPSKTHVVFKDWDPVLTFVEQAIHSAWMKNIAYGESLNYVADKFGKDEMWKKYDKKISAGDSFDEDMSEVAEESSRFQNHQSSTHLISSPLENLMKEGDHLFHEECERITFQKFQKDPLELEEENTEMEFVSQPKYSFGLLDVSFAKCLPTVPRMIDHHAWTIESSRFQDHQSSPHTLSPPLENLSKEGDHLFLKECERTTFGEFEEDHAELEEENTEEYVSQPKYSFGLSDGSFAECLPSVPWKIDRHAWTIESSRFRDHQSSRQLYSFPLENLTKEGDQLFHEECERNAFGEFQKQTAELEEENTEMEFVSQPKFSSRLLNDSFAKCVSRVPQIDLCAWTSDNRFSLKGSYFLENWFLADRRSSIQGEGDLMSSQLENEYLRIEPGVINGPIGSASSLDRDEFSNELEASKDIKKPLPQSCFSQGSLPFHGALFAGGEERYESSIGCFKYKRRRVCYDEKIDILEADGSNQSFDLPPRTPWQSEASCSHYLPRLLTARDVTDFNLLSRASLNLFPSYAQPFTKETNFLSDSVEPMGNSGSDHKALNSVWCTKISDSLSQAASWDDGNFTYKNGLEGNSILDERTSNGRLEDTEENCKFNYYSMLRRSTQEKCTSVSSGLGFADWDDSREDLYKYLKEQGPCNKFSPEHSDLAFDKADWLCYVWSSKEYDNCESQRYKFRFHNCEPNSIHKDGSRRSHSAPPFHRNKRRYISLNHCSVQAGKPNAHTLHGAENSPEAGSFKHLQQSSGVCNMNIKPSSVEDFRPDIANKSNTTLYLEETQQVHQAAQSEDFISKEFQDSLDSGTKWRDGYPQTTNNNISCDTDNQDNILDISSGLLHLAGNSLIPLSINKSCLEDAKVLQQVDKKFIPVVAGGTLAVIDQHAADERIRLEELRHKVLSGEGKSVTYLDAEQELVLPEFGYQLLHNYDELIKDWGWICNIHTQGSKSFNKNLNILHRQPTVVTLLAVPCILGVNLSDVNLLEFLQQLADTDGSSTTPPSVLRVLNSKACRGAIMFGDSLLPSECSLIVEELKQTSLCFQCAHGRPTTVPLVNLEALHKQIAQLGELNDNSSESWRGLSRREISVERASHRLSAARGWCY